MKIIIAGFMKVDPAKREEFLKHTRQFIEASRAEPGCERYDWSADLSDPSIIYVYECWSDEEGLAAHFKMDPYWKTRAAFAEIFGENGIHEVEVNKYRIDVKEPVYDETGTPRADFFTV